MQWTVTFRSVPYLAHHSKDICHSQGCSGYRFIELWCPVCSGEQDSATWELRPKKLEVV